MIAKERGLIHFSSHFKARFQQRKRSLNYFPRDAVAERDNLEKYRDRLAPIKKKGFFWSSPAKTTSYNLQVKIPVILEKTCLYLNESSSLPEQFYKDNRDGRFWKVGSTKPRGSRSKSFQFPQVFDLFSCIYTIENLSCWLIRKNEVNQTHMREKGTIYIDKYNFILTVHIRGNPCY